MSTGAGTSKRAGGRGKMSDHVSREEFDIVRDTVTELNTAVHGLEKSVSGLVQTAESNGRLMTDVRDSLTNIRTNLTTLQTKQAEVKGQQGSIRLANVWHGLGVLGTAGVIVAALVGFAIKADTAPRDVRHDHIEREFHKHEGEEGHPRLVARLTQLEQSVAGLYQETETQHRWIADVLNLDRDWQERTRGIELPPPRYAPLRDVGKGKGN